MTWSAWAILAAGLLITAVVSLQVRQGIAQDAVKQFSYVCDQVTLKVQERLGAYALILRGGAGLFAASVSVERHEWRAYVETLEATRSIPGVQGIGFALVIAPHQLAAHIEQIHREGFAQYTVRPPGERASYTSIIYLEPFRDRNLRAFGYDMFSEPVRRAAMEKARDSGEAALSGKVELVQETGKEVQAGTLMYMPVYRNGAVVATLEQRRQALIGWVYSPYRMNDLMDGILASWMSIEGRAVDLHIYDGSVVAPGALLFDNKPALAPAPGSLFYQTRTIDFNGHQWRLVFDQTEAASGISYVAAWATLIGGAALSALLAALMLSVSNTRSNAERIASRLTEEIRQHTEQLNAIFDLSPDGFITFDAAHRIRFVSPAFVRMTGLDADRLIGVDEAGFYQRLENLCVAQASLSGIAALRMRGRADAGVQEARAAAEGSETIELAGAGKRVLQIGLRLPQTETVSLILYFRDITRESEVDRMKSEFLAHAAHELRTPMASIYGFAELLLTQPFDEAERRDFMGTIFNQSKLMMSVINELLDLARIEARRGKDFTIARVEVRALLHEIVTGFKTPVGRPSPQEPLGDGSVWVRADRQKLAQAIGNVISNAYKYSPSGGPVGIDLLRPTLDAPLPAAIGAARIGIRITDHGIGMTPEQLERVGERFYRVDKSGKIPGTGLGMSIVKEIVELHGGQLEVSSQPGSGTAVTLWLLGATETQS